MNEWPEQNSVSDSYHRLPSSSVEISVGKWGIVSGVSRTYGGTPSPSGVGAKDAALTRSSARPNSMMRKSLTGTPSGPSVPGGRRVAWTGASGAKPDGFV